MRRAPLAERIAPAVERRVEHRTRGLGMTLARLLLAHPSMDEVARLVTALLGCPLSARGAALVGVEDGRPILLGSHLPEPSGWQRSLVVSSTDDLPLIVQESLRGVPGVEAVDDPGGALAITAWPIGSPPNPLGALVLAVDADTPTARVRSCMVDVVDVLSVYVAGARQSPHTTATDADGAVAPPALSSRQLAVLQWLARGLTMRQIAHRIGFSDSTVRSESLAIYRALGVHHRDEAVAAARERGWVIDVAESVNGGR